jgi:hypothetical protein
MGLIRINYSQAIRESNRLKTVANDCQNANAMVDMRAENIQSFQIAPLGTLNMLTEHCIIMTIIAQIRKWVIS